MKVAISFAYTVAALLFTTLSFVSLAAEPVDTTTKQPTAIYYHADWCPNCQALSPKFEQASVDIDGLNILVMDYTNMETTGKSQLKALELGLFEQIANNRHTGFVLMLNRQGEEVGRLYRTSSTDDIRKELSALAGES